MIQHFEAIFEQGVLKPLSQVNLPEHSRVHVSVSQEQPFTSEPASVDLELAEFDSLLDKLATEGPIVPGTFSRAEIYLDHD